MNNRQLIQFALDRQAIAWTWGGRPVEFTLEARPTRPQEWTARVHFKSGNKQLLLLQEVDNTEEDCYQRIMTHILSAGLMTIHQSAVEAARIGTNGMPPEFFPLDRRDDEGNKLNLQFDGKFYQDCINTSFSVKHGFWRRLYLALFFPETVQEIKVFSTREYCGSHTTNLSTTNYSYWDLFMRWKNRNKNRGMVSPNDSMPL